MAAKMSKKMQKVYDEIKWTVENARTKSYEEWLGPLKDCPFYWMRYNDEKLGFVEGHWNARTLEALVRRGLIQFSYGDNFDDHVVRFVDDDHIVRLAES